MAYHAFHLSLPTYRTKTGADLRAARKAAGLSQIALAQRAGIGRHTVQYWEAKVRIDLRGWAVQRMAAVLGPDKVPDYRTPIRAHAGWGFSPSEAERRYLEAKLRQLEQAEAQRAARRRVPCKAKTRKGTACRSLSEPGKRRCKFHGGMSTGPRTPEGRARIAEAQRKRWARWRERKRSSQSIGKEMQTATPSKSETGPVRFGVRDFQPSILLRHL